MLARPEIQSNQYSFAGSITLVFASGVGLCLGQPQLRGERRFERPRRRTEDQGRAARARNGGTGDRRPDADLVAYAETGRWRPGEASFGRDAVFPGSQTGKRRGEPDRTSKTASGSS